EPAIYSVTTAGGRCFPPGGHTIQDRHGMGWAAWGAEDARAQSVPQVPVQLRWGPTRLLVSAAAISAAVVNRHTSSMVPGRPRRWCIRPGRRAGLRTIRREAA